MSDITRDYSFGGRLKELRHEKDKTLRECAKDSGLDVGNYSKLERSMLAPPSSKDKCIELFDKLEIDEAERGWLITQAYSFHLGKLHERFNNK